MNNKLTILLWWIFNYSILECKLHSRVPYREKQTNPLSRPKWIGRIINRFDINPWLNGKLLSRPTNTLEFHSGKNGSKDASTYRLDGKPRVAQNDTKKHRLKPNWNYSGKIHERQICSKEKKDAWECCQVRKAVLLSNTF